MACWSESAYSKIPGLRLASRQTITNFVRQLLGVMAHRVGGLFLELFLEFHRHDGWYCRCWFGVVLEVREGVARRDNKRVVAKDQHEVERGEERRDKETIPQEEESEAGKGKFQQRSQAVGLEKRLLGGGFVVVYRARGGWEVVLITMPRSLVGLYSRQFNPRPGSWTHECKQRHEIMLIICRREQAQIPAQTPGPLQSTYEYINRRRGGLALFIGRQVGRWPSESPEIDDPETTTTDIRHRENEDTHAAREYHLECCEQFYAVECMPY